MKNIVGVAFLILVTAHVGYALDGMFLYDIFHGIADGYIRSFKDDFFNKNCNGLCLPKSISNMCQIVYNNGGCSTSRTCCVFSMRIEINLPNVTDPTPLTFSKLSVNFPGNTTLKDKETSTDDIITHIPSTTYKTSDALELDGEKDKIKKKDGEEGIVPNVTDPTPLTVSKLSVNIPGNTTLKDKETSTGDIITNIPSTTYKTTDVLELDGEKNKIKKKDGKEGIVHQLSRTSDPQKRSSRECTGECVTGLLLILCHDIDTYASCPSEGSCCLQETATKLTTSSPTTTQ